MLNTENTEQDQEMQKQKVVPVDVADKCMTRFSLTPCR